MSNNYRQFSFALKLGSAKEASWFRTRLLKAMSAEDSDGGSGHDFDATVENKESDSRHVWFRDNGEYGNVEQIADIVQEYLKKFDKKGYFTMSWADTCSKHRLGEFGGGFCVVTAKAQHWFNEHEFLTKRTKGLESRNE